MMKKIIACVFLFVISFAANAQFKGGFYLGINGSQVDGDSYEGYYKLGLNTGVTAFYPLSDYFSASMELLYSQKGSQAKPVEGVPTQMLFKLNYVEVPLLINFRGYNIKNIERITLTAGLSVARLINDTLISGPQYYGVTYNPLVVRSLHNFDYDVILGGAYQITDRWQVNIRFNYSFAQFGASENSQYLKKGMFNNVLSFRLGYILGGKAK